MTYRRHTQATVLPTTAVSSTNTYYSNWFDISSYNTVGFLCNFSSTQTGTLTLELSYDLANPADPGVAQPTLIKAAAFYATAASVTASATSISVSGAAVHLIETGLTSATWARVKYVNATNSGNLTIQAVGKVVG